MEKISMQGLFHSYKNGYKKAATPNWSSSFLFSFLCLVINKRTNSFAGIA
jgi:hypothetical protein